jgi:hypothetical protein
MQTARGQDILQLLKNRLEEREKQEFPQAISLFVCKDKRLELYFDPTNSLSVIEDGYELKAFEVLPKEKH